MYSCTMPVADPGGGARRGHVPPPPEEAVSVLKYFSRIIFTVMVWWRLVVNWGVSMSRTTAMLADQIHKRICLAL